MTKVIRLPIFDPLFTLEDRICTQCDMLLLVGWKLVASFSYDKDVVLIFQQIYALS